MSSHVMPSQYNRTQKNPWARSGILRPCVCDNFKEKNVWLRGNNFTVQWNIQHRRWRMFSKVLIFILFLFTKFAIMFGKTQCSIIVSIIVVIIIVIYGAGNLCVTSWFNLSLPCHCGLSKTIAGWLALLLAFPGHAHHPSRCQVQTSHTLSAVAGLILAQ